MIEALRTLGLLALLAPVAAAAIAFTCDRRDPALAAGVAIATAVATLVLLGLVLSARVEADEQAWIAGLLVVDLAAAIAMLVRARLQRQGGRVEVTDAAGVDAGKPGGSPGRLLVALAVGALALAIAIGAIAFSHSSAAQIDDENTFTQLWLIPKEEQSATLEVGVRNLEGTTEDYRLQIRTAARLRLDRDLELGAGKTFTDSIGVDRGARNKHVVAKLWRGEDPGPYRVVDAWLPSG